MDEDVEIITGATRIPAEQAPRISLADRALQRLRLADIFAAHIDIGCARLDRVTGEQRALDHLVRLVAQYLAIGAGAGFRLVRIDDQEARPLVPRHLGHQLPFAPGREAAATTAAQARCLDRRDQLGRIACEQSAGPVPVAAHHRRVDADILIAIEIGEDPVPVRQRHDHRSCPPVFAGSG